MIVRESLPPECDGMSRGRLVGFLGAESTGAGPYPDYVTSLAELQALVESERAL